MYLTHVIYKYIYIFTTVKICVCMCLDYCESQMLRKDTEYFLFRVALQ